MTAQRGDLVYATNVGLVFVVEIYDGMIGGFRVADNVPVIVYPEQVLAVYRRAA